MVYYMYVSHIKMPMLLLLMMMMMMTMMKIIKIIRRRCYTCPLAESYINRAAYEAGAAAEIAASRNEEKYIDLGARLTRYVFKPTAVETLGVFNASARRPPPP